MKKIIVYFYALILAAVVGAHYFHIEISRFEGMIYLATAFPAILTAAVIFINLARLIFYSQNDFLDLSIKRQRSRVYPRIPTGISSDDEGVKEARDLTKRRVLTYLAALLLQAATLYILIFK